MSKQTFQRWFFSPKKVDRRQQTADRRKAFSLRVSVRVSAVCHWLVNTPLLAGALLALALVLAPGTGSRAQTDELAVNLTGLRTGNQFPQITAFVTVHDANGLPVVGLTGANFRVIANDAPIPATALAVESDTSQGLDLVLALDVSLNRQEDMAQIKAAAAAFIDTLGPQDQVTVITFYDKVEELFRGPVKDGSALKQMVNQLEARGGRTAFYEATRRAIETFAGNTAAPQARRAVVILTNVGNNIENTAATQAQAVVEASPIPLHIVSFSQQAEVKKLTALARQTRGQAFNVLNADDLPITMQRLGVLLRPGYKVAFQPRSGSGDGLQPYRFSIQVTTPQGKVGQAGGVIELASTQPNIKLFGLHNVCPGEVLTLTAQVETLVPVASVSYQVDEGEATLVSTPPYRFTWPGQTKPGPYNLVVTMTDLAGNQSTAQADFQVIDSTPYPAGRVNWGEAVMLQAGVEQEVSRVEFWLGDQLIGRADAPPYQFVLTSRHTLYPPKPADVTPYVVTQRLITPGDDTVESRFIIEFVRPPELFALGWRDKLSLLLMAAANLVILPLLFIAWRGSGAGKRRRLIQNCRLKLKNLGNVPVTFQLAAQLVEPAQGLRFQFREFQAPGSNQPATTAAPTGWSQAPASTVNQPAVTVPAGSVAGPNGASTSAGPLPPKNGKVSQAASQAGGAGKVVVETLEDLSAIPYLGRPLRSLVSTIRSTQSEAGRVARMPGQVVRPLERIKNRTPGLAGKIPTSPSWNPAGSAAATPVEPGQPVVAATPVSQPTPAANAGLPSAPVERGQPVGATAPLSASTWAESPVWETSLLEPDEDRVIELSAQPPLPFNRSQRYTFRVTSKPVGESEADEPAAKELRGAFEMSALPWWYRSFYQVLVPVLALDLAWLLVVGMYIWGSLSNQ